MRRFRAYTLAFFAVFCFLFLHANKTHAGLILGAPKYYELGQGLVGYWSFNAQDMAGTVAYDRSGQGNNGTLTNGPTRTIGKIGQALSFDGVSQYVSVGSVSANTQSVAFWIKAATTTSIGKIIDLNGTANIQNSSGTITANNFTSPIIYVDGVVASTVNDTAWYHVVVTTNTAINASAVDLGRVGASTSFGGTLDEVRIYNRVLLPDEIKRLYRIGATLKINKLSTPILCKRV